MSAETAIRKYEDFLMGKCPFSLKGPHDVISEAELKDTENKELRDERNRRIAETKERDALAIVRYAVTNILGWKPQDAMECMTADVMKQLCLDRIQMYVLYPKDINKNTDFAYMIHKAFPRETKYNMSAQILQLYESLFNGQLKKFPRRVFEGENGAMKLSILLKYYISKSIPATSVEDLYEVFGNNAQANLLMRKAKLFYAYRELYETPLEYLHESLGAHQDPFLFAVYQFLNAYDEVNQENKAEEEGQDVDAKENK